MNGSTAGSRFRCPRTVEEESGLVSEARQRSTKYKNKWAVEIFREWQRRSKVKFPNSKVGSIFKDYDFHFVCNVEDNVEEMDAVSLNFLLAKFFQEVANKNGGRYPSRTLYGIEEQMTV